MLLDYLPGWRRLYADDVVVVHVRQNQDASLSNLLSARKRKRALINGYLLLLLLKFIKVGSD